MKAIKRSFPKSRLRRTRMKSFSRRLVSENKFTTNDVIWPVFLAENDKSKSQINLKPRSFHIMFIDLTKSFNKTSNQKVKFNFEIAGSIIINMPIIKTYETRT